MNILAQEVRITLKIISGYTYNCTDEHQDILIDLNDKLQVLMEEFKSNLPQQDGLLLRPQVRKRLNYHYRRKPRRVPNLCHPSLNEGERSNHLTTEIV